MSPKRWIPVGCLFLVCALLAAISLGMPQGNASAAASAAPAPSRAVKVSSASVPSPTASGEEGPLSAPVEGELRGLWVTYFELADLFTAPEGFAAAFDTLLERAAGQQINALFVHVRSHCDAYYESALKEKLARDPETAEMLDIINNVKTYDITYTLNTGLIAAGAPLLTRGSTDFASSWAKTAERNTKVVQKSITKLLEAGEAQH